MSDGYRYPMPNVLSAARNWEDAIEVAFTHSGPHVKAVVYKTYGGWTIAFYDRNEYDTFVGDRAAVVAGGE